MEEKKKLEKPENDERNYCKIFMLIFVALLTIKIIAFITFIVIVEMQKNAQRNEMECLAYYLKNLKLSDECFNSIGEYFGDDESCKILIDNKKNFTMTSLKERMIKEKNHLGVTTCMEKMLRDSSFLNGMLLKDVIKYSKISWKFWAYLRRKERYDVISLNLHQMENLVYDECINDYSRSDDSNEDGSGDFTFDKSEDNVRFVQSVDVNSDLYFVNN